MKVAIVCDELTEKNFTYYLLTLLLEKYPDSTIYTIIHHREKIGGKIEMRKIFSTYLSRFKKKHYFLFPSAIKTLKIEAELIITISNGFAHGVSIPPSAKHICYLLNLNKTTGMFARFLNNWQISKAKSLNNLVCSSKTLTQQINKTSSDQKITYRYPPHNFQHYTINPDAKLDYFLISRNNLPHSLQTQLTNFAKTNNIKLMFFDQKCPGTIYPLVSNAIATVDLSKDNFLQLAVASIHAGRPVIVLDTPLNREIIKSESGIFVKKIFFDLIKEKITKMQQEHSSFCSKKLQQNAEEYCNLQIDLNQF